MGESSRQPPTLKNWKKTCFAMLATVLFFVALEGTLALLGVRPTLADRDPYVGFESSLPLFVERARNGEPGLETAANKLPYFNAQRFSKDKAPNTVRVFCLGGSTTFGRPFDDRTSFAAWLRELLPLTDGTKQWEVINAGGVSYASYRVAAVMDELAQYSPDLFIVYTGHNEFLEERTYRDLKNASASFRSLTLPLARSRSFTIARKLFASERSGSQPDSLLPAEVDAILDHSVGPDSYRRDDALKSQVLEHFEFNLHRMIDTAQAAGAQLVLVTPATNMKDSSPFKSESSVNLDKAQQQRWAQLVATAETAEAEGDLEAALSSWKGLSEIDSARADVHFRIGKVLHAQGQFAEARESFQRAIDEDVCPLRAIHEIQQSVEQVAIERRIPLVDFHSIVSNACIDLYGHNSPGREFFLDHVHPTINGHRLLSLALVEAMSRSGVVTGAGQLSEQMVAAATQQIESRIDYELQARALTNLGKFSAGRGSKTKRDRLPSRPYGYGRKPILAQILRGCSTRR